MKGAYPECTMKRGSPERTVDREFAESVGKNFRVLPMFEKELFQYKYKKHYSLTSNELLQCRWRSYVQNFDQRKFEPFTFISVRDFHFYNQDNRLIPSETIHRKTDFRFKLKEGPGVDRQGQMPIPHELLMKRGIKKSETKPKNYSEAKIVKKVEKTPEKA
ncbi:uncharacterized protein LOC111351500 [Spodoptera litura]|uniref:Uncharacterized protein LOC111351500 n=1 Tax=Spodoptera litura TaxID=69820 RepID=A0A9J7DXQ1_SPOLT|nr:uncharacterized protein LOC111351500 [Spodoptera litura]